MKPMTQDQKNKRRQQIQAYRRQGYRQAISDALKIAEAYPIDGPSFKRSLLALVFPRMRKST